jgi:hypothetical protein
MSFEDRFAQSLRDTGEDLTPVNLTRLVNGGVADGRRRRRRRSAAVAGGSTALALVAVAVGAAVVPSLTGATHPREVAGPAARPSMSLAASGAPISDRARAQQMVTTLESLLPKTARITDATGRWALADSGAHPMTAPLASLVYDDGKGASSIELALARYPKGDAPLPTCGDPAYVPNDVCHVYQLPGGGRLLIDQGYEYPSRGSGTKDWHAVLDLPDGSHVEMDEWNAAAEKGSGVTRATPPLSPEQLRAIVTSHAWQPLLAAVPKPHSKLG